jgi:hypothetical protein
MSEKVSNLSDARRKKRDKTGWTTKEIKEHAKKELKELRKHSKDEPNDFVSGDMDKMIRGADDDD